MRRVEGFNGSTLVLDCGNRFADTIHFLCWQFVHGRAFLTYKSLCVPQLLLHDNLDIVIQRKHPEDFLRLCITVLQQGWTATSTAIRCCPFRTEAQADEQDWTSHQCKFENYQVLNVLSRLVGFQVEVRTPKPQSRDCVMAPLDEVNVQPGLVRDAERQGDDLNINIYTVYIYLNRKPELEFF